MKVHGKRIEDLNEEDMMDVDRNQLEKAREAALKLEKTQKIREYKKTFKANDHLARALREEEIPLIKEWAAEQQTKDKEYLAQVRVDREEESKAKHVQNLEAKKSLMKFTDVIAKYKEKELNRRNKQYEEDLAYWTEDRHEFLIEGKVRRAKERYYAEQERLEREERAAEMRQQKENEARENEKRQAEAAREREEMEQRKEAEREARRAEREVRQTNFFLLIWRLYNSSKKCLLSTRANIFLSYYTSTK